MERIYPDSNVLYPISVADLLLRLGDIAVHEVLWSEYLLSEVERILVEYKGLTSQQATYFCACVREAFPSGEVQEASYRDLIATRSGPDPHDHVHSAAAIGGRATILLTSNTTDYPADDLGDVRVMTPDEYLLEVLEAHPEVIVTVVEEMGSQRRDPQPVQATLAALSRAGLGRFAKRFARLLS